MWKVDLSNNFTKWFIEWTDRLQGCAYLQETDCEDAKVQGEVSQSGIHSCWNRGRWDITDGNGAASHPWNPAPSSTHNAQVAWLLPKSSPGVPMRKSIGFLEMLTKLLPRTLNTMVFVLLSVAFPDNLCSSSQDPKG